MNEQASPCRGLGFCFFYVEAILAAYDILYHFFIADGGSRPSLLKWHFFAGLFMWAEVFNIFL